MVRICPPHRVQRRQNPCLVQSLDPDNRRGRFAGSPNVFGKILGSLCQNLSLSAYSGPFPPSTCQILPSEPQAPVNRGPRRTARPKWTGGRRYVAVISITSSYLTLLPVPKQRPDHMQISTILFMFVLSLFHHE